MYRVLPVLAVLAGSAVWAAPGLDLAAPNRQFSPVNQLRLSGNACGPAALLNAYGFGSEKWQKVGSSIPGEGARGQMSYIIRAHGLHPSRHLPERLRWDRKNGINLLDLTDIANELRGRRLVPQVRSEVLVLSKREDHRKLLVRAHERLAKSLKKGLPPIVSLRRMAYSASQGENPGWRVVHGHFVVVVALPGKLNRKDTSFPIRYVDPWGGRILDGRIRADGATGFPSLLASVPSSKVGVDRVRKSERSIVTLSAAIGAF